MLCNFIITQLSLNKEIQFNSIQLKDESSRPEVFCKKGVLRNFAKFTGKYLLQSLFFKMVAGLRLQACNFIKKETLIRVFSCEFCKISKNIFFHRTPPVAASEKKGPASWSLLKQKRLLMHYIWKSSIFNKNQIFKTPLYKSTPGGLLLMFYFSGVFLWCNNGMIAVVWYLRFSKTLPF